MLIHDLSDYKQRQLFYQSTPWKDIRSLKLQQDPLCERHKKRGELVDATEVHHKKDLQEYPTFENALNIKDLESLCKSCHSKETYKIIKEKWKKMKISKPILKWEKYFMEQNP